MEIVHLLILLIQLQDNLYKKIGGAVMELTTSWQITITEHSKQLVLFWQLKQNLVLIKVKV